MNRKRMAFLTAAVLSAEAAIPLHAAAVSRKEVDHLLKALTVAAPPAAADDYNTDGCISAVDLTLMKRDLLKSPDTGTPAAQSIPADAAHTKLIGRTLTANGVTWLVHSGSAVECTVTATEASVTIAGDSAVHADVKYRPRYGIYVNDELIQDVVLGEEEQVVPLFTGSKQQTVTVKIMHLSEANNGAVGVKQFDVLSSAAEPVKAVPAKSLSIEFIGDSITCAYGVEAETQYVGFETGTENFSKSYAYLTAQLLDADYSAVSYSGYGIVSGYTSDGSRQEGSLVPPVYGKIAKQSPYAVPWDFAAHPSDVIVVNLGTNDSSYASKDIETRGPEYQAEYASFLKEIRQNNPDAAVICMLGIMGGNELYPYLEAAVQEVGDEKITCYQAPTQKQDDGYGADWHPSAKTHQLNAYLLADKICTAIGRESSKIGIDLAADGEYGVDIDKESGANAWPYFSEWDKSLNVNVSAPGTSPESITAYVRNLNLPAGSYELSFNAAPQKGIAVGYAVRSMHHPEMVYCTGTMNTDGAEETVLKAFDMPDADDSCEIVVFIGETSSPITFRNVTLYKRA